MRGALPRALRLLALPTVALLVVAVFASGRLEQAIRVYALVVCAVILVLAVAALRRTLPGPGKISRRARSAAPRLEPPRSLAQLENESTLAIGDSLDLHFRLRPHLRLIAAGLLEGRHGIALDEGEKAKVLLGGATWELLREDRPIPEDRHARGLTPDALERVVLSLERL